MELVIIFLIALQITDNNGKSLKCKNIFSVWWKPRDYDYFSIIHRHPTKNILIIYCLYKVNFNSYYQYYLQILHCLDNSIIQWYIMVIYSMCVHPISKIHSQNRANWWRNPSNNGLNRQPSQCGNQNFHNPLFFFRRRLYKSIYTNQTASSGQQKITHCFNHFLNG